MKLKMGMPSFEKLRDFLKRYKFVLIVIAAGVLLLAIPDSDKKGDQSAAANMAGGEEDFSVEALEEKLSEILSRIEGAGEVSVMLTVRSGMERVLATDQEIAENDTEHDLKEETVIISTDAGDEVVLIRQNYPVFQGALVVCQGGDDPEVQLQLTRALSALTGLNTNRITVCKGS